MLVSQGMGHDNAGMDALTEQIIGCGISVHNGLGPGLLESVYRDCLIVDLTAAGLEVKSEQRVSLVYKGHCVADGLKLDLVVEAKVVVEVKAVERLHPVHLAQVITYLKLTGHPVGLLMNFNALTLKSGLRRLTHPDLYSRKIRT